MNTVEVLLFEKLDVYRRLSVAFDDTEERFWKHLGKTLGTIIKEVVGPTIEETFSKPAFWDDPLCYAYRREWLLDFGSARDGMKAWELSPSFWFPKQPDEYDTFALMGLGDDVVHAAIWATPLSRYAGDLAFVRKVWDKDIAGPLTAKGWEPYGQRVTSPTGDWGLHIPIRLDQHEIAQAMQSGDLRQALSPLERAVLDFGSVCPAMDDIIKNLRTKGGPSKQKS